MAQSKKGSEMSCPFHEWHGIDIVFVGVLLGVPCTDRGASTSDATERVHFLDESLHFLACVFAEEIEDAFRQDNKWQDRIGTSMSISIIATVEDIFEHSIQLLERTLDLNVTVGKLSQGKAKQQVIAQREKLIGKVEDCIEQLSKCLAEVQTIGINRESAGSDLQQLQDELDITLKAAREVDNTFKSLGDRYDLEEFERYATQEPKD